MSHIFIHPFIFYLFEDSFIYYSLISLPLSRSETLDDSTIVPISNIVNDIFKLMSIFGTFIQSCFISETLSCKIKVIGGGDLNFAERLKLLRKELNLTQEELAIKLNRTRSTIAGYETERKQPDYDTLKFIADFFNVSTDYLLGRTENRDTSTLTAINNLAEYNADIELIKELHKLSSESQKDLKKYIELLKLRDNKDAL